MSSETAFSRFKLEQKIIYLSRQIDVLFGGLAKYTHDSEHFNSSIAYFDDDYTWCVQRAKILPLFISFMRIADPATWLLIVGSGYVNGIVLYFFVKFDTKTKHHKLDLHHITYLISLPSWIGVSQRFHPKYWPLRLYYFSTLLFGIVFFAVALSKYSTFSRMKIRKQQIQTVTEIIDMDFRLFGTDEILKSMQQHQQTVST